MGLGDIQPFIRIVKYLSKGEITKKDIEEFIDEQLEDKTLSQNPLEILDTIQVKTRDFSSLITEVCIEKKKQYRKQSKKPNDYKSTDIQERLGVSKSTFSVWRKEGKFPNSKLVGKFWFIPENDLLKFLEEKPKYFKIWNKTN